MTQEIKQKGEIIENVENPTISTKVVKKFEKGHKKFGGRGKGTKNKDTIKKEEALKAHEQGILKELNEIRKAQISLAEGISIIVARDWVVNKQTKKLERTGRFVRVKNEEEVLALLNGDYEEGNNYYNIFLTDPNAKALEDLVNRLFGRPKESIDLTSGGEALGIIILPLKKKQDENLLAGPSEKNK